MLKIKTRMIRINDEIVRVTAEVIRSELSDPRVGSVVSVIGAETTADLKYCKIRVSIIGDKEKQTEAMEGLTRAAGFVRKRIAETINLRQTPEIKFVYDDSIEHGMRMRKLIDSINK
jgi:ribosome-binding factor A